VGGDGYREGKVRSGIHARPVLAVCSLDGKIERTHQGSYVCTYVPRETPF